MPDGQKKHNAPGRGVEHSKHRNEAVGGALRAPDVAPLRSNGVHAKPDTPSALAYASTLFLAVQPRENHHHQQQGESRRRIMALEDGQARLENTMSLPLAMMTPEVRKGSRSMLRRCRRFDASLYVADTGTSLPHRLSDHHKGRQKEKSKLLRIKEQQKTSESRTGWRVFFTRVPIINSWENNVKRSRSRDTKEKT